MRLYELENDGCYFLLLIVYECDLIVHGFVCFCLLLVLVLLVSAAVFDMCCCCLSLFVDVAVCC